MRIRASFYVDDEGCIRRTTCLGAVSFFWIGGVWFDGVVFFWPGGVLAGWCRHLVVVWFGGLWIRPSGDGISGVFWISFLSPRLLLLPPWSCLLSFPSGLSVFCCFLLSRLFFSFCFLPVFFLFSFG